MNLKKYGSMTDSLSISTVIITQQVNTNDKASSVEIVFSDIWNAAAGSLTVNKNEAKQLLHALSLFLGNPS